MSITKTSVLLQVTYDATVENEGNITAHFQHTIDDPDDGDLPVTTYSETVYPRYSISEDEDGNTLRTEVDMGEVNAVVKAVADAVWL